MQENTAKILQSALNVDLEKPMQQQNISIKTDNISSQVKPNIIRLAPEEEEVYDAR